jgi:hypothetical protein
MLENEFGGVLFLHYCSHCGHEIPHREKFCQHCGTRVEYLCALPPLPSEPAQRREVRSAASITKWIVFYFLAILLTFSASFFYYSSPESFSWTWPFGKSKPASTSQPISPQMVSQRADTIAGAAALKNAYNQLSVGTQKAVQLVNDARKVNVAGDPKRTAANYRSVQSGSDAILAQLSLPPDASTEVGAVVMPLKECLSLLSKSSSIMADYLDGKLSLAPPNPDWVGRSQEYFAQSQARLKESQQALSVLRKKIE